MTMIEEERLRKAPLESKYRLNGIKKGEKIMAHIFVITGETGKYDDWMKWNVGAFLDGISCYNYLNKLNKYLTDNNIPLDSAHIANKPQQPFIDNVLEENWMDLGVEYKVEELELFDNR